MAKIIRVESCPGCPFSTQKGIIIWCMKIHKKVPTDGTIHSKCKLEDAPLTSHSSKSTYVDSMDNKFQPVEVDE